jgi:hypothetical protein
MNTERMIRELRHELSAIDTTIRRLEPNLTSIEAEEI